MIDYSQALTSLYKNCSWEQHGLEYSGLVWKDTNIPKPTEEELVIEYNRLQEEKIKNEYKQKRQTEYPAIGDQLDMLWHMMDGETIPGKNSSWYNIIKEVKDNNPK